MSASCPHGRVGGGGGGRGTSTGSHTTPGLAAGGHGHPEDTSWARHPLRSRMMEEARFTDEEWKLRKAEGHARMTGGRPEFKPRPVFPWAAPWGRGLWVLLS